MSIDHGKVLAVVEEMTAPLVSYKFTPSQQAHITSWANKLRALAQPAEAREYCPCMKEDCPKCYAIQPAEAVEGDLDLSKLEDRARRGEALAAEVNDVLGMAQHGNDAAHGAVATVCLVGERYAHGHMVSVELQLAGEDAPAPKIGDRYYTHPQAAPAQGASLRHANPHLAKESVERNVRSSSALEGISTQTFQAAADGDKE